MTDFDFDRKDAPPPAKPGWKRLLSRTWLWIGVIVVIVTVVVALSVNDVMKALLHSRAIVTVPDLQKKTVIDALETVSSLKLTLAQTGSEFDESVPAGTIVRQHPPAGMEVRAGRAIRVVVSKGGEVVFVPNIEGIPVEEAQSKLALEALQLGAVTEIYSSSVSARLTMTQQPKAGAMVTRGALVDLVVSRGLPPAGIPLVPDFSHQSLQDAKDWAEGVNIKVSFSEDAAGVGRPGAILRQEPSPGQPAEDSELNLVIVPLRAAEEGRRFEYLVPPGPGDVQVGIKARGDEGEFEVYEGRHRGGDAVQVPIDVQGTTRVRVYLDGRLAQEVVLEP